MKTKITLTVLLSLGFLLGMNNRANATKHIITQLGLTFSPSSLSNVNIGDTIRWVWTGGFHTTTSTTIPAGASSWDAILSSSSPFYEYHVLVSGMYNYVCTPHASLGMTGSFSVNSGGGSVTLSGNVYDDANGLLGSPVNTVDGTGTNAGGNLFSNLVDNTNHVLASMAVSAGGVYSFGSTDGVQSNTLYHIILTNNMMQVGFILSSATLPVNWVSAGENLGSGAGSDGFPNSILNVQVNTSSVTNANFGIERLPTAVALSPASQYNPGGNNTVSIPAISFSGTDPESPAGYISQLRITSFPTNVTSISINGSPYTSASWPVAGVLVPTNASGNPTQLIAIDPLNQTVTSDITFSVLDNAGKESSGTATVHVAFNELTLSGTVYDDADGLLGSPANTINGTGTNAGGNLFVNLVDNSNHVIVSQLADATGTFSFNTVNGLQTNTPYRIILTNTLSAPGSILFLPSLPNNWVSTGEFLGSGPGNDGIVNSVLTIPALTAPLANANFGLDQLPAPVPVDPAVQVNPGGTVSVSVLATSLGATDPESPAGYLTQLRILTFPVNVTSFTVGSTTYYPETWPTNGLLLSTNASGNPVDPLSIDPFDGAIVSSIDYSVLDNAGQESSSTATLHIAFTTPFNTINGTLSYNNTASLGLPNSTIYLRQVSDNALITSVTTNSNGAFSFTSVPDGNYLLQASTTVFWGGVNATDALTILKHFVGISPLSGLRLAAANVDNNSFVNSLDALVVSKRFVGLISTFPVGDWRFQTATVNASGNNTYTANFQGICFGDADGSYNNFVMKMASPVSFENTETRTIRPGQQVTVPLTLTQNTTVGAVSLVINLPNNQAQVKNVVISNDQGLLTYNQQGDQLKISWFSLEPLTIMADEPLLFITFEVNENLTKGTILNLNLADYSELADADAKPIQNVTIKVPTLLVSPLVAVKHLITQTNLTFVPNNLTGVFPGDTVEWKWTSGMHTTTSGAIPMDAAPWDHVLSSTSTTFNYIPVIIGEYNYVCTPHVQFGMIGKFTVSNPASGIATINKSGINLIVSPNPVRDNQCILTLSSDKNQEINIKLYNLVGEEVEQSTFSLSPGTNTHQLDLNGIKSGMYIVQIFSDQLKIISQKLIKQ